MNDEELQVILKKLQAYLATDKQFITNPFRETEIKKAIEMASELFPDAKIELRNDPLQMGAMILHIENFDISASGEREIKLFCDIVSLADNFEIYPIGEENVCFAAVFQNAKVRI